MLLWVYLIVEGGLCVLRISSNWEYFLAIIAAVIGGLSKPTFICEAISFMESDSSYSNEVTFFLSPSECLGFMGLMLALGP